MCCCPRVGCWNALLRGRRLAREYEFLIATLTGYHWLAFALLMLKSVFAKSALQALIWRLALLRMVASVFRPSVRRGEQKHLFEGGSAFARTI